MAQKKIIDIEGTKLIIVPGNIRVIKEVAKLVVGDLNRIFGINLQLPFMKVFKILKVTKNFYVRGFYNTEDYSISVGNDVVDGELGLVVFHEMVHAAQLVKYGRAKFVAKGNYQYDKYGYTNSRFEVEARSISERLVRRYEKEIKRITKSF
jgi:CRISPR/Cas system-associated exonuclease Cas4 (RecB family)